MSQERVRSLLVALDPEGVNPRRSRRLRRTVYRSKCPNEIWHIDGYDKLSPYGICVHGCIDGFSRKIIWSQAYMTNHDPAVIGGYYYIKAIKWVSTESSCRHWNRKCFRRKISNIPFWQRFVIPIGEKPQ